MLTLSFQTPPRYDLPPEVPISHIKRTLGTPEDRKTFTAALAGLDEFNQLAKDCMFPARFPALEKRLKELGEYPHVDLAESMFGHMAEAVRPQLAGLLGAARQTHFMAAVVPTLDQLDRRLLKAMETAIAATDEAEAQLYASWGIRYHEQPLATAIRSFSNALRIDIETRGASRYFNFMGEDPAAILNAWFTEPLAIE